MTILTVKPLGFPWETADPFLFCVHHLDHYPAGNEQLGPPPESLAGRRIGMDFEIRDGWRMYHGDVVPGFPRHPHRGFETITIVRQGLIDHADSMGATARFGGGDLQWMTAGDGVVHSEMFPLVDDAGPNTAELFQIWLNLPAASKRAEAHFTMHWDHQQPRVRLEGGEITVHAGVLEGLPGGPTPPPASWASHAESDIAIATLRLQPGARTTLPPARPGTRRTLYFFDGPSVRIGDRDFSRHAAAEVRADEALELQAGDGPIELLLLQGRPIGEPVAHHGPFVTNTQEELRQAFVDYQRTGFGGWPWESDGPVHARSEGRFAVHADGRRETP